MPGASGAPALPPCLLTRQGFDLALPAIEQSAPLGGLAILLEFKQFEQACVDDPRVRRLLPLCTVEARDDLVSTLSADAIPALVSLTLKGQNLISKRVDIPIGDPRKPMSDPQRQAKFVDCTASLLDRAAARLMWEQLEHLEEQQDLARLLAPLCTTL